MNTLAKKVLNRTRKLLGNGTFRDSDGVPLPVQFEGQDASDLIHGLVAGPAPCMIARLGRTELETIRRFWFGYGKGPVANAAGYVSGRHGPYWWDQLHLEQIRIQSGVFPNDRDTVEAFSRKYIEDIPLIDVLGSWCEGEADLSSLLGDAKIVGIRDLEPFFHERPWTAGLEGMKVLVIHPFAGSIAGQFGKRRHLFGNPQMLPDFELKTMAAVQSLGGKNPDFGSWFDAYESMAGKMEKIDFDVALIGAGAYGLPLAAHAKRIGRKAVHVGGALQLFFGIRGRRWDEREEYRNLVNEHWIRPDVGETPAPDIQIEGGCYW